MSYVIVSVHIVNVRVLKTFRLNDFKTLKITPYKTKTVFYVRRFPNEALKNYGQLCENPVSTDQRINEIFVFHMIQIMAISSRKKLSIRLLLVFKLNI